MQFTQVHKGDVWIDRRLVPPAHVASVHQQTLLHLAGAPRAHLGHLLEPQYREPLVASHAVTLRLPSRASVHRPALVPSLPTHPQTSASMYLASLLEHAKLTAGSPVIRLPLSGK
jgi:hypothetical protein